MIDTQELRGAIESWEAGSESVDVSDTLYRAAAALLAELTPPEPLDVIIGYTYMIVDDTGHVADDFATREEAEAELASLLDVEGEIEGGATIEIDAVTLTCPHCAATSSIAEYNVAVAWCQIEDSEIEIDDDGTWGVTVESPSGDYDGDGWICTSCLRRDINLPVEIELDYC